jgi:hypothetical protein
MLLRSVDEPHLAIRTGGEPGRIDNQTAGLLGELSGNCPEGDN